MFMYENPKNMNVDMFPRTAIFQKLPKNRLTCSCEQMVIKMASQTLILSTRAMCRAWCGFH